MRKQLRPFHDDVTLSVVYSHPYDHTRWSDHIDRVNWTIAHGIQLARETGSNHLVDLSCGDGAIVAGIQVGLDYPVKTTFGDLVPAEHVDMVGPIEKTIRNFDESQAPGSLLVLTETLEHLCDPDFVLRAARSRFRAILVSTPIDEDAETHDNIEHYWSWGTDDVSGMLVEAGWTPIHFSRLDLHWYDFQLWGCR